MAVETMFPDIYESSDKRFFTFQKPENQFSQMALDHVREQNNRTIKSCGGAADLVNKVDIPQEYSDIPQDMIENFLGNSQNKNNLNEFLSKEIIDLH